MNQQKVGNNTKVKYEMTIEENKEFELKVDEQQLNIKHLLEQCDIEDEDKVQEITAARTQLKIINMVICVKQVIKDLPKKWKEKYTREKHTELWSSYCGKIFIN